MNTSSHKIILVGCGNMGGALLQGWLDELPGASFSVIEPAGLPKSFQGRVSHATKAGDIADDFANADTVVLAVKPQILDDACAPLREHVADDTMILSIAAGKSIAVIAKHFSERQPIVRTMPNLPAAVGKGMTVACKNDAVSDTQNALADTLLKTVGKVEWIEESLINAATAVMGNGPAYVFYLIEVLSKAGAEIGLPPDLATTLARQTVIGAAALAENKADIDAAILRENVTSPGGTTEAALNVLMNGEIQDIYNKALEAGKARGEELDGQ